MKRSIQIATAEHSLLCNQSYLDLLKNELTPSDYIKCITSHTELLNERLYRYHSSNHITFDEFSEAKSIAIKVHNAYMKKGNLYVK